MKKRYPLWLILLCQATIAGEVTLVDAKATQTAAGVYRFDVTLEHSDSGWDHYADRWDVVAPNGEILGSRILYHPHVNEQPFTRSLSGVTIPTGVDQVDIRAHDKLHGDSPQRFRLILSH